MISLVLEMRINAEGSSSLIKLRSRTACGRFSAVKMTYLSFPENAPCAWQTVALRFNSLSLIHILEKEQCYLAPEYTEKSEKVRAACDIMNSYLEASVTYEMTEPVVVDRSLIGTWITVDQNMEAVSYTHLDVYKRQDGDSKGSAYHPEDRIQFSVGRPGGRSICSKGVDCG